MTFEEIMKRILHVENHPEYVPYITKSGSIPSVDDPIRSDYDDISSTSSTKTVYRYDSKRQRTIHGGVDIIYGEMVNGKLTYIGLDPINNPDASVNQNATVYSPVKGRVILRDDRSGKVAILDEQGYVHTFVHMKDIPVSVKYGVEIEVEAPIGVMSGMNKGKPNAYPIHLHYEITTYVNLDSNDRQLKIDPEAFWNNYPATADGFFTLTGSFKKSNQFYGTSNKEILRGEGVRDNGSAIDPSDNDTLSGGGGKDIIDGGSGNDRLFGGNAYGDKLYYEIDEGGDIKEKRERRNGRRRRITRHTDRRYGEGLSGRRQGQ